MSSYRNSSDVCTCCAETDVTENIGHCFLVTTWRTARDGRDHDGEVHTGSIGNSLAVSVDGRLSSGVGFCDVLAVRGAELFSSQWTGRVPGSGSVDGDLAASTFPESNLRVRASVVQGHAPTRCFGNCSFGVVRSVNLNECHVF